MSIEKYSKRSEEEVVRAFKSFIKIMIVNSACNFKRKFYTQKIETVPFDEFVENKVSLSMFDDGIFFPFIDKNEEVYSKYTSKYKFSNREKQIIKLIIEGYSSKEIKSILKISDDNYTTIIDRIRKKIRRTDNGQ